MTASIPTPKNPELLPALPPDAAAAQILAAEEDDALEEALAAAEPGAAALAVSAAPGLERKTEILWAMEDRQRRHVLERVPPALVGALVQNLEEDNKYLLGDLSFEQFRELLRLCSPERRYYWITTALSFTDARANALPLLLPTRELVDILLTRPGFEDHLRSLGEFPLENQRLPPDMLADPAQALVDLFGADLLREFPVEDEGLRVFLQTLLDYDPDRYADLAREGLRQADYYENHPVEYETLIEQPILLSEIVLPGPASVEAGAPDAEAPETPLALVPMRSSQLAHLASGLPEQRRAQVANELQMLFIRQAVADGGSFLLGDLQRSARGVEAYLLLGLRAESGGRPEAEILAARPLNKLVQSGARLVEALRQVALRLQPLGRILDAEGRSLVESLVRPRLTLDSAGEPRLQLRPGGSLPEFADLETAGTLLQRLAAWSDLARGLGLDRTAQALTEAGSLPALQELLAVGAVLFGRLELGLAEPADRRRFAARYVGPEHTLQPGADEGLRKAAEGWSRDRGTDAGAVVALLRPALERLARQD